MSCTSWEERGKKIKDMYDKSMQSISSAIARLSGRAGQAEQSGASTEQPVDQSSDDTEQSDQRVIVNARRSGRSKQS